MDVLVESRGVVVAEEVGAATEEVNTAIPVEVRTVEVSGTTEEVDVTAIGAELLGETRVDDGLIILTPHTASESNVNGMFLAAQSALSGSTASANCSIHQYETFGQIHTKPGKTRMLT